MCPQTNLRKSTCDPKWEEELVLPVFLPAMQDTIKLSCWDWNATGADEAIGVAELSYSAVADEKWGIPRWLHLYGGPTDGSSMRSELANRMNMGLAAGTHYRGSILLSAQDKEEDKPQARGNTGHGLFGRGHTDLRIVDEKIHNISEPETTTWVLWLDVLEGNDLPVDDMASVVVELGHWRAQTSVKRAYTHAGEQVADFRNGRIVWYEMLELAVQLPNDIEQIPDIFISVLQGKQRKSFLRYRPRYPKSTSEMQTAKQRKEALLPIPGNGSFLLEADRAWGSLKQGHTWMMPKWQFMKLDPFNQAGKEEFAGNLLFAIGFGREVDMPSAPRARLSRPTHQNGRQELYDVRAHIYQARDLPSADENGAADPYVMLRVGGRPYKATRTKFETRFPVWYETLSFEGVALPAPDDITRNLGPMLTLLVMDQDDSMLNIDRDGDFLGRVQVASGNVNQADMPVEPTWYPVFSGNTNTSKGKLLVSFQLIPHKLGVDRFPLPKLQPPMVKCTIDILLLGARGLLNSSLAKSEPRKVKLSVEGVDLAKGTHVSKLSKEPSQCDPNWLERVKFQVKLPIYDEMYLPVINVSVLEAMFYGMSERTLSTCAIDLAPYCSQYTRESFSSLTQRREAKTQIDHLAAAHAAQEAKPGRRPQKPDLEPEPELCDDGEKFELLVPNDSVNGRNYEKHGSHGDSATEVDSEEDDDDMGRQPRKSKSSTWSFRKSASTNGDQLEMTSFDQQQQQEEEEAKTKDDAASQSQLVAADAGNRSKKSNASKRRPKFDTDEYDLSEPWTKDREEYDNELEDVIRCAPFEQWTLIAGQSKGDGAAEQPAGQLKARITVTPTEEGSNRSSELNEFWKKLNKPEPLLCRVYIINATGLTSRDSGGGSDPYLKLRLGRKEINDSKNRKSDTLNPEFRSVFEFQFGLPGEALLHIELYDWDMLGFDEMIGATTVDLENRWFSQEWLNTGAGGLNSPHMRPIELRTLHVPGRRAPQGKLRLWVDILPTNQVKLNPLVEIKRPEPELFELRVCVFRGRRLPLMDGGDMTDYFCSVAVDGTNGDDSQSKFHLKGETDTHFRARGRRATWNWRLKFEISGPVRNARLSLQCYDFDVFGANDICGEWMFADLTAMIARAVGRWRAGKRGTPHIVTYPAFHGKQDREWVSLTNEQGKPAGEIEIQMQLVHKDLWQQHPAGEGRAAPNANPTLHEPQDRMSMNPLRPVRNVDQLACVARMHCLVTNA